ncbi:MAG TPA: hypothetical protein ENN76_03040, partial [Euryarchaeota archaeon]|nr:hypothetical protein [Euryarchaeota archaeon]
YSGIPREELHTTFNMGMGMVMVAKESDATGILNVFGEHDISAKVVGHAVDEPAVFFESMEFR